MWPVTGPIGYTSLAFSGSPRLQEGSKISSGPQGERLPTSSLNNLGPGGNSTTAHKWANSLHDACGAGCSQHLKVGDKISSGPQLGKMAT